VNDALSDRERGVGTFDCNGHSRSMLECAPDSRDDKAVVDGDLQDKERVFERFPDRDGHSRSALEYVPERRDDKAVVRGNLHDNERVRERFPFDDESDGCSGTLHFPNKPSPSSSLRHDFLNLGDGRKG